ncbi:DUF1758 domain-containing protein [Trichonephila clavipes]|nr:DUF1758 domain-containing protein [Trichonephila clavipes]
MKFLFGYPDWMILFKEFERLDSNLSLEESEIQEFKRDTFYLNAKFNDKLDELNVQNQESRRLWAIKSSEEEFPNMKAFLDFLNEGASAETRNEASEFKGQAEESQIYSGASVNSELNLSFLPTAKKPLATKWKTFQKEFEQVCSINIPRWIHTASQQITLHGFVMRPSWPMHRSSMLCSRKPMEYDVHFYAWTDSQVVLSWLSSHPRNWKPYIANRTSEILDLVPADSWRYVPTKMNPADIACRGLSPKELPKCVLWWEGPQWLSCEMDSWPKQPKRNDQTSSVSKEKKTNSF